MTQLSASNLSLWYREPAERWVEALPGIVAFET